MLCCSDIMKKKVLHININLSMFQADLGAPQKFCASLHTFQPSCTTVQIYYYSYILFLCIIFIFVYFY